MKSVKVTKKMLKMHPSDLLLKMGAANVEKKQTYPQHVYFSGADYKELRSNLQKQARKEYPGFAKKRLDYIVEMTLLDFGPNESLGEAIKPGWVLVDEDRIKRHRKNNVRS